MITASIKMGQGHETNVQGDTIEQVIEKIITFHTMSDYEVEVYTKNGLIDDELSSGWWMKTGYAIEEW